MQNGPYDHDCIQEVMSASRQIRAIRTEQECSLIEARQIWEQQRLRQEVLDAVSLDDFRKILLKMIDDR